MVVGEIWKQINEKVMKWLCCKNICKTWKCDRNKRQSLKAKVSQKKFFDGLKILKTNWSVMIGAWQHHKKRQAPWNNFFLTWQRINKGANSSGVDCEACAKGMRHLTESERQQSNAQSELRQQKSQASVGERVWWTSGQTPWNKIQVETDQATTESESRSCGLVRHVTSARKASQNKRDERNAGWSATDATRVETATDNSDSKTKSKTCQGCKHLQR